MSKNIAIVISSLALCLSACGDSNSNADSDGVVLEPVESYQLQAASPLNIIICKATAADTGAVYIEHTHIRSSDSEEINRAKDNAKKQALKICQRYSDRCKASCN